MDPLVTQQARALRETFPTVQALVRFLAGVDSQVPVKVGNLMEPFPALGAFVSLQARGRVFTLSHVRTGTKVPPAVSQQILLPRVFLGQNGRGLPLWQIICWKICINKKKIKQSQM